MVLEEGVLFTIKLLSWNDPWLLFTNVDFKILLNTDKLSESRKIFWIEWKKSFLFCHTEPRWSHGSENQS